MKEKLWRSIVVVLGLVLVFAVAVAVAQSTTRSEGAIGRYQVVTVSGDANEEAQAFKIDTVTGRVWMKVYLMEGSNRTVRWVLTTDYLAATGLSPR